ncbi:glycosyltransferase family 2 protein [Rhodobaculum claviforme]|uniref:Glycosyltransferase 2-like domain-containing protein n=1 Tax=Rhodobaculum claviforme TaxID=1549854 RepID=A0A934TH49_9RHOB|nr:glycosyltransferase family 2 protein [Rhodobaculum claviforme]MBK5926300.1 hypothetical protein [Rhodobaculum claviforme]
MTTEGPANTASVIVTGRDRPADLVRCMAALRLQDHCLLEVVVVACPAGLAALERAGLAARVKSVAWTGGSVAAARNLGLRAAAGEVVAFLDNAAVPEPPWLSRLVAAFADSRVEAATGFVRTRCGMRLRHRAAWVDVHGVERPLVVDPALPSLHQGAPGAGVRLWPATRAFRRETLAAIGGFDPAFTGRMDGADLELRLAAEEVITAVVPLAQVHPAGATPHEAPAALGADRAVFLRKHAPDVDPGAELAALRAEGRAWALRAMVAGRIEPRDVTTRLAALEAGFAAGLGTEIAPLLPIAAAPAPFQPLPGTGPRPARTLVGGPWAARRLARMARDATADGAVVTVLRLSPTPLPRRMVFTDAGHWLQSGGLWARAAPAADGQPGPLPLRPRARFRAEITRIAAVRPVDTLLG